MANTDPATQNWHIDRRLPVALMLALALQSATAIWWAATTSARISNVETAVQTSINFRLNRIEDKLDRIIENRFPPRLNGGT